MFLALALIGRALAAPVELQAGVPYAGGTALAVSQLGVSLTLPAECGGQLVAATDALVLRCDGRDGLVAVLAEPQVQLDGLVAAMSVPLPLELATTLLPAGTPTVEGDRVHNAYKVLMAPRRAGLGVGVRGDNGTGVLVLAAGLASDLPAWQATVDGLVGSLVFSAPAAAAAPTTASPATAAAPAASAVSASPPSPPSGALAAQLAGKRLKYLYSNTGYTDEWSIDLCSDGTFVYRTATSSFSSGGFGGDFSASAQGGDVGAWQVEGEVLTLRYQQGAVEQAPFVRGSDGWYHGQTRYFLLDENDACR